MSSSFFFYGYGDHRDLHSFPTRRSSDLTCQPQLQDRGEGGRTRNERQPDCTRFALRPQSIDRKSTRLNSSHTVISYAVFCLKKKKTNNQIQSPRDSCSQYNNVYANH